LGQAEQRETLKRIYDD